MQQASASALSRDGSLFHTSWGLFAAGGVLLLYALNISDSWLVSADSALYLMLANNLAAGEGYTLWGHPHLHVPPGLPALLALFQAVGLGQIWVLHALQACFALVVCGSAYAFYRGWEAGPRLAVCAAVAVAVNHQLVTQAGMILSELAFMTCVTAALACYHLARRQPEGDASSPWWLVAAALSLSAALAFRAAGVPLVLGAVAGTWVESRQLGTRRVLWHTCLMLGLLLSAAAACCAYYWTSNPDGQLESYAGGVAAIRQRGLSQQFVTYWQNLRLTSVSLSKLLTGQSFSGLAWLSAVPALLTVVGMGAAVRSGRSLGVVLAGFYVAALLLHEPLSPRYLLPLLPLWTWYACLGFGTLISAAAVKRASYDPTRLARWAIVCALLLAGANLPKSLRSVYRRHRENLTAFDHCFAVRCYHPRPETCIAALEVANYLQEHRSPGDRFVVVHYPHEALFHRQIAYLAGMDSLPIVQAGREWRDASQLEGWTAQGVNYVIVRAPSAAQAECAIRRAVTANPEYRQVFANERYEVYRNAASASGSTGHDAAAST